MMENGTEKKSIIIVIFFLLVILAVGVFLVLKNSSFPTAKPNSSIIPSPATNQSHGRFSSLPRERISKGQSAILGISEERAIDGGRETRLNVIAKISGNPSETNGSWLLPLTLENNKSFSAILGEAERKMGIFFAPDKFVKDVSPKKWQAQTVKDILPSLLIGKTVMIEFALSIDRKKMEKFYQDNLNCDKDCSLQIETIINEASQNIPQNQKFKEQVIKNEPLLKNAIGPVIQMIISQI